MEKEMTLIEKQNSFAALEVSDEDLEFVSGGATTTTVTCSGGTKPHIKTGTDSNGNIFVKVKCF
jgi:hypothetical protein